MLNSSTARGGGGVELEPSSAGAAPPPDASAFSTDDSDEPESLAAMAAGFSGGATSATFRSRSISQEHLPIPAGANKQGREDHLGSFRHGPGSSETAIDPNRSSRVALRWAGLLAYFKKKNQRRKR
jgi:hypothetical protein